MNRRVLLATALVAAVLLAACGAATTFTPRGAACAPQPRDCEFEVISRRPARDYQVIGMIDVEAFSVRAIPKDEAAFRRVIRAAVCRAGGDAVVPGISGDGRYVTATVVKWVEEGATAPVCLPDAGTPDGGAADAAAEGGATEGDAGVGVTDGGVEAAPASGSPAPAAAPACDGGASC